MTLTPETWKADAQAKVKEQPDWLARLKGQTTPYAVYGYLSSLALWPLLDALGAGQVFPVMNALGLVAGSVGGNLLANRIEAWRQHANNLSPETLEQTIRTEVADDVDLRQALDDVLAKLEMVPQAQQSLSQPDRQWLADTLRQELTQLGTSPNTIDTIIGSDNLIIQGSTISSGDRSIAASHVKGDVLTGDNARTIKADVYNEYHAPAGDDPTDLRRAYLERVMARAGFLSLAGIDPRLAASNESDARLSLSAVYTALLTTTSDKYGQIKLLPERGEQRLSALHQLNRHSHLVLLGDPGSGKSTFANFVALCLAGDMLAQPQVNLTLLTEPLPRDDEKENDERQPWDHPPLLPVPVVLRDFAARGLPPLGEPATAKHLYDFIVADLHSGALAAYAKPLTQTLLREGGLLLLDGLDEVPEADRRRVQMKQAITDFAATFKRCRILVTSRTYAYQQQAWRLPGFNETVLAPFSQGQIGRFVERWYAHMVHLRGLAESDAQGRAALLKRAIFGSDRLRGLAERPLLLTLMASLHAWRGGNLPEKREELYADAVDLLLDTWETRKVKRDAQGHIIETEPSLTEWLRVDRDAVRGLLNRLAFDAHSSQPDVVGTADVSEGDLVSGLLRLSPQRDLHPGRLVDYLNHRAGLLLPRGVGVYTFPHRTFQEYLAACHLTDADYPDQIADLARRDPNRWREVALLAGAKAARGTASAIWSLVDALCYASPEDQAQTAPPQSPKGGKQSPLSLRERAGVRVPTPDAWGALLAGQALVETATLQPITDRNQPKVTRVRRWLVRILADNLLPAVERAAAGRALARLGDDRPGVGLRPDGLPDIIWCDVPAGPFVRGSEKGHDNEKPPQTIDLPSFKISRYPVTNVQYQAFVATGGYQAEWYWPEAKAEGYWQPDGFQGRYDGERRTGPVDYGQPFNLPNHPVVGVSWYEAIAFSRWLTDKIKEEAVATEPNVIVRLIVNKRWQITLPSENQWEKAARGPDGRDYPWGSGSDLEQANHTDTGLGTTSAVGCFAQGAGPYGVEEMSGNVWEWCRTKWQHRYHGYADDNILKGDAARVLRGGSFNNNRYDVRCAARYYDNPNFRYNDFGFRVVVSRASV